MVTLGTMLRCTFAALLVAFLAACPFRPGERIEWRDPSTGPFETGPYVLLGEAQTAHVAVKIDVDQPPVLEWWRVPAAEEADDRPLRLQQQMRRFADLWVASLRDLPLGDEIAYRIVSERGSTEQHRFRAGPAPGEPFRFAAFGDTRTNHAVHRDVVLAMARERIDFVVHTGDMVAYGGKQESWDRFFQIERPLLDDVPIVPAIGNHDLGARNYYRRYFLQDLWTRGRRYFVLDWGNFRLLCLDIGVEGRSGSRQFEFADRALREGAAAGKLMAIALHYPPYSSGSHGSHDVVRKIIKPLARRHGVELVIAGHDHNYERTVSIDGTTYVVSGSAGAPIRPVNPRWFTAEARTEPHFVLIDVQPMRMILRAVNLSGNVFDSHVIEANPPAP